MKRISRQLPLAESTTQKSEETEKFEKLSLAQNLNVPLRFISDSNSITNNITKDYSESSLSLSEILKKYPQLDSIDIANIIWESFYNIKSRLQKTIETSKLVEDINKFLTDLKLQGIKNDTQMIEKNRVWRNKILEEIRIEKLKLNKILNAKEQIKKYKPMKMSPITFDRFWISVNPDLDYSRLTYFENSQTKKFGTADLSDGLEIFNAIKLSYNVPFVTYHQDQSYFKIYKGKTLQSALDFSIISKSRSNKNYVFALTLWTDNEDASEFIPSYTSFVTVYYDLNTNKITFTQPFGIGQDKKLILSRLEEALPIKIKNFNTIKIGGNFSIYDVEFDAVSLADRILNDSIMSTYLFIDETKKSLPFKKRLKVHIRDILDFGETPTSLATFSLFLNSDESFGQLNPRTPMINVVISRATSEQSAISNSELFSSLIRIYSEKMQEVRDMYNYILKDIQFITKPIFDEEIKDISKKEQRNIEILKSTRPDLFVGGYAKICQRDFQPKIVNLPPEFTNISNPLQVDIEGYGVREVWPFPPNSPNQLFYFCPQVSSGFPGIKKNRKLVNRDRYPYVPCCFQVNQINKKPYREYYLGVQDTKKRYLSDHTIEGGKIAPPNRKGRLTPSIQDFLNSSKLKQGEFYRLGVIEGSSPNSFLHCVVRAWADIVLEPDNFMIEYLNSDQFSVKEEIINAYRNLIVQSVHSGLLKQELYDFTESEIRKQLEDPEIFLDPQLYYRAVEEVFQVNIFVFTPEDLKTKNFDESGSLFSHSSFSKGRMEFPRFKLFLARARRNRPTIMIYKHNGTDADDLEYPQCELIIDLIGSGKEENVIRIFDDTKISDFLYDSSLKLLESLSWNIEFSPDVLSSENFLARTNLYSIYDFSDFFGNKQNIKGQIIDTFGKLRAYIVESPLTLSEITLVVIPSQPGNYPILNKISIPNLKDVLINFAGATATYVSLDTSTSNYIDVAFLNGIWFKLGNSHPDDEIDEGFYCPFSPLPVNEVFKIIGFELPFGSPNPLASLLPSTLSKNITTNDPITRIKELKKLQNLILQYVMWAFLNSDMTADTFNSSIFTVVDFKISDSLLIYTPSPKVKLSRFLPSQLNLKESLTFISTQIPNLSNGQKFQCYSLKLKESLSFFIQDFEKTSKGYILSQKVKNDLPDPILDKNVMKIPTEVYGIYESEKDFSVQDYITVVIGEKNFSSWLFSSKISLENIIHPKLEITFGLRTDPYIYSYKNGLNNYIYMIQNIFDGNIKRALNIAYNWYINQQNLGYRAGILEIDGYPPFAIYGIATDSQIILLDGKNLSPNEPFLQILSYGSETSLEAILKNSDIHLGAMLPLFNI